MDFSGRIGRRRYIVAQLFLVPLGNVALCALGLGIWNINHSFPTDLIPKLVRDIALAPATAWTMVGVATVAAIVSLVGNLSFTIRRLHDLGFSGWFLFLWPILALLMNGFLSDARDSAAEYLAFEAVLMMVPGIAEANIYGANPHHAAAGSQPS